MTQYGTSFGYPIQITFAGLSWSGVAAPGVSTISAIDPSFNGDEFLTFARDAFLRVEEARQAGRIDDVRPLVSEVIWPSFRRARQQQKGRAVVSLEHATIYDAHRDQSWDSVTVRFAAKTDARRDDDLVEDWTFQRPAVTGNQQLPVECPICGAPLSLDENGACTYCRVTVGGARGGWKLTRALPAAVPPKTRRSSGSGYLIAFIVFMILMTVVLPIAIILVVTRSTTEAFGSFGGSPTTLDGPAVKSQANERVGGARPSTTVQATLPTTRSTLPKATGAVDGSVEVRGAVTGTADGLLTETGAGTGTCAAQATTVTALHFVHDETDSATGAPQSLTITVTFPPGASGPGTYTLGPQQPAVSVTYDGVDTSGDGQAESQSWDVGPITSVNVVLGADNSGTVQFTDLAPAATKPVGNSLGDTLSGNLTFTCS